MTELLKHFAHYQNWLHGEEYSWEPNSRLVKKFFTFYRVQTSIILSAKHIPSSRESDYYILVLWVLWGAA